jgi:hypothetical protein
VSQQQVIEQVAVAGVSTNVIIPCNLGLQNRTPFWYINGSVHELFSIPHSFLSDVTPAVIPVVESYAALDIPIVTLQLDGTTFQCAVFSRNDLVMGLTTRLTVVNFPQLGNLLY